MKKHFLLCVLLIGSLSAAFVSCKKDSDTPTPAPAPTRAEMITGRWTLTASGADSNYNNALDPTEYDTTLSGFVIKYVFKADSSGMIDVAGLGLFPFNWNLQNKDTEIRLVATDSGMSDTSIAVIITLTQNRFEIYDKSSNPKNFALFTR